MAEPRVWTATEMEAMSPDERADVVAGGFRESMDGLSPELQARVESKSQRIATDFGLLESEQS